MKKEIGIIGLGKMGGNMARRLNQQNYDVVGFDVDTDRVDSLAEENIITPAYAVEEVATALEPPRTVWISVPKGDPVDDTVDELAQYLEPGDTVIDGGNSDFRNAEDRYNRLQEHDIHFLDAGCSGGPEGALNGLSIMVGGDETVFEEVEQLFDDLSVENGYAYLGPAGTGHKVKNVHNGVEYGMMEAIAEGLDFLRHEGVDLGKVAQVWNNGAVVESYLMECMQEGLDKFDGDMDRVSGKVPQGGTAKWTVEAAKEQGLDVPAIQSAVEVRDDSMEDPMYRGKLLRLMRHVFGGHSVKEGEY